MLFLFSLEFLSNMHNTKMQNNKFFAKPPNILSFFYPPHMPKTLFTICYTSKKFCPYFVEKLFKNHKNGKIRF